MKNMILIFCFLAFCFPALAVFNGDMISIGTIPYNRLSVECVNGIKATVEATIGVDYTKRDGSQKPTDHWSFDGFDLTDLGTAEADLFTGIDLTVTGQAVIENLKVHNTIEIGLTPGRIWYDGSGNLWLQDDFITINLTDLLDEFDAKADKVSGAIAGNFAGLDASGNLTDSGYSGSSYYAKLDTYSSEEVRNLLSGLSASDIGNDSTVPGLMVSDALDELQSEIGSLGSVFTQIELKADNVDSQTTTVTLSTSGAGDLQAELNELVSGDVLEILTNATYSPIVLNTSEITIKAGIGYSPKITGANAIKLGNGLHDVIVSGLILDNCTTANQNYMGACVSFGVQGSKVQDIIFKDVAFVNVTTGSAVMLSYHGFTDSYSANVLDSECSERVAFVDCVIHDGCNDPTEGAAITLRGMKYPLISHCTINGADEGARGILLQAVQKAMIRDNIAKNMQGNGEGIKIDEIGTAQFINTGIFQNNMVQRCIEGIDIDDKCAAILYDNTGWECTEEAFSLDDSSQALFKHNTAFNNVNGIRLESGSSAEIRDCVSFNNSNNNYWIQNGYILPADNSQDINDTEFAGTTANNTAYNNATYRNVDSALTYLFGNPFGGLNTSEVQAIIDEYSYNSTEVYTKDETDGKFALLTGPDDGAGQRITTGRYDVDIDEQVQGAIVPGTFRASKAADTEDTVGDLFGFELNRSRGSFETPADCSIGDKLGSLYWVGWNNGGNEDLAAFVKATFDEIDDLTCATIEITSGDITLMQLGKRSGVILPVTTEVTGTLIINGHEVEFTAPSSGEVLIFDSEGKIVNMAVPVAASYQQTVEVWTATGASSYGLANNPSGQVIVTYARAVQQLPGIDYTVSGSNVNFTGATNTGEVYSFAYIYSN